MAENAEILNTVIALKALYDAGPTEGRFRSVYFEVDPGRLLQVEFSVSVDSDKELQELLYNELVAVAPQIVKKAVRKRLEKLESEMIKALKELHCWMHEDES